MKNIVEKVSSCCGAYSRWNQLAGEYNCQKCGNFCRTKVGNHSKDTAGEKSRCCGANLVPITSDEGTGYYQCQLCKMDSDPVEKCENEAMKGSCDCDGEEYHQRGATCPQGECKCICKDCCASLGGHVNHMQKSENPMQATDCEERAAMNIVYQLSDDMKLSVAFRQENNDKWIDFVKGIIHTLLTDAERTAYERGSKSAFSAVNDLLDTKLKNLG